MVKAPPVDRARITAILDRYQAELQAIARQDFITVTVSRERVQTLTEHIVSSMSAYEPLLDQELSTERTRQRRDELRRLSERAQAFYAADLLAEEAYTPAEEKERRRLFEQVAEHDRTLLKWARPLFGDDPERAALLDDIQSGTGHQDSADDVVRLVTMFRGHWDEAEGQTPITKEYLDEAEADATRMLEFLSGKGMAEARDLARRAYTAWARDYRELMALGRYLARHAKDALVRFPGIHAERTGGRGAGQTKPADDAGTGDATGAADDAGTGDATGAAGDAGTGDATGTAGDAGTAGGGADSES